MHLFLNPFKKEDKFDVAEVLIPLEQAHHGDQGENGLSLESLKQEVDNDLQSGGVDTAYDRTTPRIPGCIRRGTLADNRDREIKSYQQGDPGYWHGPVSMGVVHAMRVWLDCGQVSSRSKIIERNFAN